jgi:uncharacterized protein (TIRG00374 family)
MKFVENIKKNTILLLGITVIVLYFVLKDDFEDIIAAFRRIDYKYIIVALIFFFLSIIIKAYVTYIIVNNKKKVSFQESIKHNLITQFFNGVTPFSTGGQPMEIYMLTEHNISVSKATNQTIQSFIFYQIALVICGFLAVLCNYFLHLFPKVTLLQHLVLLGFIINIGVALCLIMISYSKKTTNQVCKLFKWLFKILKIKKEDKELEKSFNDFYNGFQEMKKRKGLFTVGVLLNIASLLCLYIVPLFILYSMTSIYSMNVYETLTASAYVYVMGSFVPIPGASGGIEYGFTQFFGNFIGLNMIGAVLIIWRTITYYLGIITGAILFNFEKKVKE